LHAVFAEGVIALQDYFGIAIGKEAVAARFQLSPYFAEVVNATIERDREPKLGIDHRLVGRRTEIENTQAAVAQRNIALGIHTARVRPTMFEIARYCLGNARTCSVAAAT